VTTVKPLTVSRLSGADRYATSAAISAANVEAGAPVVYIASGEDFPDALSGAPVAAMQDGPVLLVRRASIPDVVKAELRRLDPGRIVVLGGTAVVSSSVATALRSYTDGGVTRLAGADRYGTSAAISAASFSPGVPLVFIASGSDYPDALSGAAVAGRDEVPVLLVLKNSIPAVVQAELTRLAPGGIVVLGGTSVVSDAVASALQASTTGAVTRISGPDRYATSAAISAASFDPGVPIVYIASGENFPDALSGAAIAGMQEVPVLLVRRGSIPDEVKAELTRLAPDRIVILGGTAVVSTLVAQQLFSY
jgi:putative cell wall-binding protein